MSSAGAVSPRAFRAFGIRSSCPDKSPLHSKENPKLNLNPHAREREKQVAMNRNQTNRILFTKEAGQRP